MEIFNKIDSFSILIHLSQFLICYIFYRVVLKGLVKTAIEDFEKNFREKIKNDTKYSFFCLFYAFFGISIWILVFFLMSLVNNYIDINIFIASEIILFLYCGKQVFINKKPNR